MVKTLTSLIKGVVGNVSRLMRFLKKFDNAQSHIGFLAVTSPERTSPGRVLVYAVRNNFVYLLDGQLQQLWSDSEFFNFLVPRLDNSAYRQRYQLESGVYRVLVAD